MTCIAGIAERGTVTIGGDSAAVATEGFSLMVRADEKVFMNDGLLFGFTTSFRMGDILRYQLAVPVRDPDEEPRAYMVRKFIPALRAALRDQGWLSKDKEREAGGTFLVGCAGRLFVIEDDLQVGEASDGYTAVGCGHELAKGALYATQGQPAEDRIRTALQAAERHNAAVRGPFVILSNRDGGTGGA